MSTKHEASNETQPHANEYNDRIKLPFVPVYAPEFVSNTLYSISDFGDAQRRKVLGASPDFVLNNSTNIIGSIQLVAEVMAFKSTGAHLIDPENRGKPLHYLIDPPKNIIGSLTSRGGIKLNARDLLNPSFYKDTAISYIDLGEATRMDLKRSGSLINRWQARSGLCGITAMAVATVLPNAKDDPLETERMTNLYQDAPLQYLGTRLGQALYVPGWGQHKTQFAGLGMLGAGACSFLSGFRNVSGKVPGKQKYYFNWAHSLGGLVTAAAGSQLMFGVDNEQSWQNYGSTQFLRLPILAMTIGKKFQNFDVGAKWYTGAAVGFQSKNLVAYMIGGAERDADGNLIDKKTTRKQLTNEIQIPRETDLPFGLSANDEITTTSTEQNASPSPTIHSTEAVAERVTEEVPRQAVG